MADAQDAPKPDLKNGVSLAGLADGAMLVGRVDDEAVVLARRGDEIFAVSAHCTHYHGPLADGLIAGDTVRCPWHHACFSLRTGEALRAPALDPIACWRVERRGAVSSLCARHWAPDERGCSGNCSRKACFWPASVALWECWWRSSGCALWWH